MFLTNFIHSVSSAVHRFLSYIGSDDYFLVQAGEWARNVFIATSIVLVLVMIIARPRNLLDISLTLRELFLSMIITVTIISRRQHYILPQWFILTEFILISIIGVMIIWAIVREYLVGYWEQRSVKSAEKERSINEQQKFLDSTDIDPTSSTQKDL